MNRKPFYETIRTTLFKGKLTTEQVAGMEAILNEWQQRSLTNLNWLAYMLATVYHETAATIQPIEEYGKGRGRDYGKIDPSTGKAYYGRGFVQLTWLYNYKKFANTTGIDLVRFPEKACELPVAVQILFDGMIGGMFTGVRLSSYFNDQKTDWEGARRIINGTDKASLIAGHAKAFLAALQAAQQETATVQPQNAAAPQQASQESTGNMESATSITALEQATAIAKELTTGDSSQAWWQRAMGSKIVWANALAMIGTGGILPLIELTQAQQADLAGGVSALVGAVTIIFRVWFNRQH